ncbi:N-6 DNA methylase, partial [Bacillus sp. SIMBA_161]
QASPERIARLWEQTAFKNLATSKKRKDEKAKQLEIETGQNEQQTILSILEGLDAETVYLSRSHFVETLEKELKARGYKPKAPVKKAILNALG